MSYGALTPTAAIDAIFHDALHHIDEPVILAFLKNIAGGLYVGMAGLTSLVVAGGCPSLDESNPGLVHLIEGSLFSTGLIMVYFTGAELFTGYPMWLTIAALQRKRRWYMYVRAALVSLVGNFIGALLSGAIFSYGSYALSDDPYRSYVVNRVYESIIDPDWHTIFVKAIACGFLVTLSMILGTQNQDGVSKALMLWVPFTLATASRFPHTVEYMHVITTGMLLGAPLSIPQFLWRCILPISLGNFVGGAIFNGLYPWYVFLHRNNGEEKITETFGERQHQYIDEED